MKERRPIRLFVPNTITLINLAVGVLAVMEAWNGRLPAAALYVVICAVLDFFDGFAARMLKAYSDLGKQLDSLADLVSFGVAPGALAAGLLQAGVRQRGWDSAVTGVLIVLVPVLIPVFSGVRLARFNIEEHKDTHFNGMPVPADAAAFAALALVSAEYRYPDISGFLLHPLFIAALIVLNSWLMVAPISMFSFKLKNYRPGGNFWRYIFAASALSLVVIFRGTGLFAAFLLYVAASIVMNIRLHFERKAGHGSEGNPTG